MKSKKGRPYFEGWRMYLAAGYTPLPLPEGQKSPPPFGWTGGNKKNSGEQPARGQCETWQKKGYGPWQAGNIALRLPKNVVGIDVDMYDGKEGRASLAAAEERWGPLPPTWVSSSRSDGSGIRLFRVTPGLSWASEVGPGIEIIRWDHRYAVVSPSIHPNGEQYLWLAPPGAEGAGDPDYFPGIDELTQMPEAWQDGLTDGGREWVRREEAELNKEEVAAWVAARAGSDGPQCPTVGAAVSAGVASIAKGGADGGLHECGLRAAWGVLKDAARGHTGLISALTELREAFLVAAGVRSKARRSEAVGEWFRIVDDGVRKVSAEVQCSDEDSCSTFGDMKWDPEKAINIPEQLWPLTDIGNSMRMQALFGEDIRWNSAEDRWLFWKDDRWQLDRTGVVEGLAKKVAEYVQQIEAGKFDGSDAQRLKDLKAHAKALGRRGARLSMLDDVKSIPEMTVVPEDLNANPRLLQCGTRLVWLGGDGVQARTPRREDYQTLTAGATYDPKSHSAMWEEFLKKVVPDEDVRRWLQKAIGYSLRGGNPERKLFIMQGLTSSGKSTFIEAVGSALGQYAASFEITLFRAQKEQGPNVQLVRLLEKRMIFTTETSSGQYIHADTMKRIAGNDRMSSRLIRSNDLIDKTPQFTPWIAVNDMATVRGADAALARRLVCVPFDEQMGEDEIRPDFLEHLIKEARPAILAWAVAGWDAYAREGLGDVPSAVAEATMRLRGELSEIDIWLTQECEREADGKVSTEDLFRAYQIWAEDAGIKDVENKIAFAKIITNKLGRKPDRIVVGGKRLRGFVGIQLRAG